MELLSNLKWKVSAYNRRRKLDFIISQLPAGCRLVDVGVEPIQQRPSNTVNYIEEYFLRKNRHLDVLALESDGDYTFFREYYSNCDLILFDGRNFPRVNEPYDVALSNAVIEHVGTRAEQLEWLKGLRGICKKLIITTPNRFFPVESHTNVIMKHILSRRFRERLMTEKNINLFSLEEFTQILKETGFKIKKIKKDRLMFLTLDFVVVCES